MRALLFNRPDAVELVETPTPEPGDGEALVRIEVSAICGSELKSEPGSNPGHEAAGVVEAAPAGSEYRPGDRVGVSAVTGCGDCEPCRRGVQLHCANGWRFHGAMHADFTVVPERALRRLPAGAPPGDGALITGDALGVPVRAHRRVPSQPGERVVVLGLGPVGLAHTLVRTHDGAEVVAVEPSEYRRRLALELGAAEVLAPGEDLGAAPGMVIECTGLASCVVLALDAVEAGGTVLQSGECPAVELNPSETLIRREITYTGVWYYADEDFPEMVRLYEEGLPVGKLVTHEFPADQIAEAYRAFVSREAGKVLLRWS
jgi:threonine dehydrogenase-like Zn-dependent dehydrogenase